MLGLSLGSCLFLNDHISTAAKADACKLGLLFRSRRYFTPIQFLTLYKPQLRPCLEYGSEHSLSTLDEIQKRAIKLIGDPALTNSLDSLAHRTNQRFRQHFYPMTSRDSLPATVFLAIYNLQLYKTRIPRYLRLLPSP